MNILVTGSNGFIGSHVAKHLHDRGHLVIGLGRTQNAHDPDWVDYYIQCDLSSDEVADKLSDLPVCIDAVIHLAADMRKEPYCVDVVMANCGGTQRLLEYCESHGIDVFLQLSSLPVIGSPKFHPITEEHPIHPYTVYHITKRTEELLADYADEYHGVRTASFRISAPIGPRCNPKTIFPTFVRNAMAGNDIKLLGKGTRKQNYLYVKDIAECLELSLTCPNVHGVYNLTSNLLISNLELAETCKRVLDSTSNIILEGTDPSDNYIWDASLEKITRDSGYIPKADIEDIIREYATWIAEEENHG